MNIDSPRDVGALVQFKEIELKQKLQKKIDRLYWVPTIVFLSHLMFFGGWFTFTIDFPMPNHMIVTLLLMNISVVGHASMQRMDAIRELDKMERESVAPKSGLN